MFATLLLLGARSYGEEPTNREAAIQAFAQSVGVECAREDIERLGLSKEQCDQRHLDSIEQCKGIAATGLPEELSQVNIGRAMLRFSLCRGMLMQGKSFDLEAWEPTITEMLNKAHEGD
jgi:hypothetical protein